MAGTIARRLRRAALWLLGSVAVLTVGLAVLLALPVREWRTGERFENVLPAIPAEEMPPPAERVWIDTDPACGAGERVDPDDCLAILHVAMHDNVEVVGLSTVFGNAPLDVTDRIARELTHVLAEQRSALSVHTGAAQPRERGTGDATEAQRAIIEALAAGPLTFLALGPLTNVAAALDARPDLAERIERVVAVMGRRPGHVFHPSEASGEGMLFGHGPIFRDLNVAMDPAAVETVLAHGVPLALVPYEAARSAELDSAALDRIAAAGPAHRWVAERARGWLRFWNSEVGRNGFYPFDLAAAAFVVEPHRFLCADVSADLRRDVLVVSDVSLLARAAGGGARSARREPEERDPLLLRGPRRPGRSNRARRSAPGPPCLDRRTPALGARPPARAGGFHRSSVRQAAGRRRYNACDTTMRATPPLQKGPGMTKLIFLSLFPILAAAPLPAIAQSENGCAPAAGLDFVCGLQNAEDLVPVPGTDWIIASSLSEGLALIDTNAATWSALYPGPNPRAAHDPTYAGCSEPPDPATFNAHGLNLHAGDDGHSTLYAVAHGERESIEVFDVDATGEEPVVTWEGCVILPEELEANSVASFPDGSLVATVLMLPGRTFADSIAMRPTGIVIEWSPGDDGFTRIEGTELPGNNGIEVSPDGDEIYVVSSGFQTVVAFSNTNPARELRSTEPLPFTPDNVHLDENGRLLTAGMKNDVPECGGKPGPEHDLGRLASCPRGTYGIAIDPATMDYEIIVDTPATTVFSNATMVLTHDGQFWLGSFAGDRVAYGDLR